MTEAIETSLQSFRQAVRRLSLDAAATYAAHMSELDELKTRIEASLEDVRLPLSSRERFSSLLHVVQLEQEKVQSKTHSFRCRIYEIRRALGKSLERRETEGNVPLRDA